LVAVGALVTSPRWLPVVAVRASNLALARTAAQDDRFAYASPVFTTWVEDSCRDGDGSDPQAFYRWFADAYQRYPKHLSGKESLRLDELLDAEKEELAQISDPAHRTAAILDVSNWLHRMVKTTIPRFSLDRGFEFRYVVQKGERQCFLQSVLVSGLLQRMGVDAGVAMVSRNIEGAPTNNGHAVSVVRLPDGTHTLVDCSDPTPFVRHQGLFVRVGGYRYVLPVYRGESGVIRAYLLASNGKELAPSQVHLLDNGFLRSQFYFYRGERVTDGLLSSKPTPPALEASAEYLRQSVKYCPDNPLAVFSLARVYVKQGKKVEARATMADAHRAYTTAGWEPAGPRDLLAQLGR
jgi:hypothetical protein